MVVFLMCKYDMFFEVETIRSLYHHKIFHLLPLFHFFKVYLSRQIFLLYITENNIEPMYHVTITHYVQVHNTIFYHVNVQEKPRHLGFRFVG